MRYKDGFGVLKAHSLDDLKYGEYKCTHCNKIISEDEIILENSARISLNSIMYCSDRCKKENQKGYDQIVTSIFRT